MHCGGGDVDSGRSSCSAGSTSRDIHMNAPDDLKRLTRTTATNTELRVSSRPRSCVGLPKSPDERDPFPINTHRVAARRNTLQSLFDTPRKGGLSSAHSTLDIISSTRIEQPIKHNAISLTNVDGKDAIKPPFKRGKPVQRAASRLYSVENQKGQSQVCVGPEFIIRASQPVETLDITNGTDEKRIVTVVLLTGQRIDVTVEPNSTTAGQIFEAIVKKERYDHSFMLGLAILVGGDFVFLPDDYKVRKMSPEGWFCKSAKKAKDIKPCSTFTAFLRIKFFLPTNIAKSIQGGEWRYRVYLQLRRSTLEGQLATSLQNLILLAGYALHIEFGDFFYREHGSGDYFLLEHYLPEGCFSNDTAEIKLRMKRAHESRKGMDREKAIVNYIVLAQTYRDYGSHFYSAVWATRDGFCRDVWLAIGPKGITIYSRNTCISAFRKESNNTTLANRIVLQSLAWHHIHTFHFNRKTLYIVPNSRSGLAKSGMKYKIKMEDNKSYFTFWLASLHHRLYLKLHAKQDFIDYMSDELSCPVSPTSSEDLVECSNYQDSYNLAVRNQQKMKRPLKRRFRMDIFTKNNVQNLNKENEKPDTRKMFQELLSSRLDCSSDLDNSMNSILSKPSSSNEGISSSESSLPRRQGVKMGTRAFHGVRRAATIGKTDNSLRSDGCATHSDSDDLSLEPKNQMCNVNGMKLLPSRNYNEQTAQHPTAYVIESPKVYNSFVYNPNAEVTTVGTSLIDKLDSSGFVQGERCFVTSIITRDSSGTLGMQVAEGSDGNVYIKSITPNGPTDVTKKLTAGDQIISVNGQTLLNIPYRKALSMLQATSKRVELIVLQNVKVAFEERDVVPELTAKAIRSGKAITDAAAKLCAESIASDLNELAIDQEIINEEALKTIHALIRVTKQNVIMRMKEQSNLNTPNKLLMQKCLSENKIYDESDTGNYSSQENTPQKKPHHFDTCRLGNHNRAKRRPLSLHIPANIELSEKFFENFENESDIAVLEKASMNQIQTSLQNLGEKLMSETAAKKNVAVPRYFGLSRKWLGPVKYPVTPLKDAGDSQVSSSENNISKKHFIYGGNSESGQLFL